jgi:hypothetical protein
LGIRAREAMIRASLVLVAALAGIGRLALAAGPASHLIDIPAEDLGTALLRFAADTHQQIAFDYKLVQGYRSAALSGTYTVRDGLHALIGTAPFVIQATPSGVLTVAARPLSAGDAGAAAQSSAPAQDSSSALGALQEEVVVRARRSANLEPRAAAFVNGIAVLEQGQGLARWHARVCPQVTGLPREDGEFILERISEIARGAGVPLAGRHCRPDLFIFVTTQPKQLLQAMEERYREVTFGNSAPQLAVEEFIARAQPVRVWYRSGQEALDYAALQRGALTSIPCSFATIANGALPAQVACEWERSSRITPSFVRTFSYVYVVVDLTRMRAVTWLQLADYLGMVSLAEIRSSPRLGDVPSILGLFNGLPEQVPGGMSSWDQAYLKSLYTTEESLKIQRASIAKAMVREMLH